MRTGNVYILYSCLLPPDLLCTSWCARLRCDPTLFPDHLFTSVLWLLVYTKPSAKYTLTQRMVLASPPLHYLVRARVGARACGYTTGDLFLTCILERLCDFVCGVIYSLISRPFPLCKTRLVQSSRCNYHTYSCTWSYSFRLLSSIEVYS